MIRQRWIPRIRGRTARTKENEELVGDEAYTRQTPRQIEQSDKVMSKVLRMIEACRKESEIETILDMPGGPQHSTSFKQH